MSILIILYGTFAHVCPSPLTLSLTKKPFCPKSSTQQQSSTILITKPKQQTIIRHFTPNWQNNCLKKIISVWERELRVETSDLVEWLEWELPSFFFFLERELPSISSCHHLKQKTTMTPISNKFYLLIINKDWVSIEFECYNFLVKPSIFYGLMMKKKTCWKILLFGEVLHWKYEFPPNSTFHHQTWRPCFPWSS